MRDDAGGDVGKVYRSDCSDAPPNSSPDTTTLTVLTTPKGQRATKVFSPLGVEGYGKTARFAWREAEIASFADLAQLLDILTTDDRSMIVQGAVAEAWRDKKIIPRWKNDRDEAPASLTDAGSRAIHFDIDKVKLPEGCSWADPEAAATATWRDQIVARLPAFEGVSFFWQASSSAGTKGKAHLAKFHLWALLDQPVDEATRKAILKLAGADESLALINQSNFTASPIFTGVPDPLAGVARSGSVLGAEAAVLADIALPVEEIKQARQRAAGSREPAPAPENLTHGTTPEGAAILASTCARIAGMGAGGRHNWFNKAAYAIGGRVAGGSIAFTEAQRALLEAGAASGHTDYHRTIEDGLWAGLRRPIRASGEDVDDGAPIEAFYDAPEVCRGRL